MDNEENKGKFVLIDIDTGQWEIDADEMAASRRMDERLPDAQVWMVRIGSPYAFRGRAHPEDGMITGTMNVDREAVLRLTLYDVSGQAYVMDMVIDTGFNGQMTLLSDFGNRDGCGATCRDVADV